MSTVETGYERAQRIMREADESGEPIFVLRAKDVYSVYAIEHYGALTCYAEREGWDPAFGTSLDDVLRQFRDWRVAHPELVKTPDVRA